MVEEGARLSTNSHTEGMGKGEQEMGENEEFYETIEAPKFVDFTVPEYHLPDDRYWFCSRVGCDQKHEEEMDSEAIYNNFVLRVMAARSPNVRLHKALNRDCSCKNLKCPLSVPPKSSKSRLSRLAVISSMSLKMEDNKRVKPKPVSKLCSTPKAKGKPVAAKYLTTPRNKKCIAKPQAFRSAQNSKPSVAVSKERAVVKTLTFASPKKAFNLKASVELRTPMTKLCEKMKKLEITSEKKTTSARPSQESKQLGDRPKKSMPIKSSIRQTVPNNDKCRSKVSPKSITRKKKQDPESTKGKSSQKSHGQRSVKKVHFANEVEAESRDGLLGDQCPRGTVPEEAAVPILNRPSSDATGSEARGSSNSPQDNITVDDIPTSQTSIKEDNASQGSHKSEMTDNDDKENATAFDENRSLRHKDDNSGRNILVIQNSDRKKVNEAVVKDNGAKGVKPMKLKPTNPKPFKFRTDERGILREANLEKKSNTSDPQKEHHDNQKGIADLKPIKKEAKTKALWGNNAHLSKQEEKTPRALTCENNTRQKPEHVPKKKTSSNVLRPQRHLDVTSQAKTISTVNTSSGNSKLKEIRQCKKTGKAPASSPASRMEGKTVTSIQKEPNFQRSSPLMPMSCAS